MTVATVFLWLTICLDGSACTEWDAYRIASFDGPSASADCDAMADERAAQYAKAPDLPEWRLSCGTEQAFHMDHTSWQL